MSPEAFPGDLFSSTEQAESTLVKREGLLGLGLDVGLNLGGDKKSESRTSRGTTPTPQPISKTPIATSNLQSPSPTGPPATGAKSEPPGKVSPGTKAPGAPTNGEAPSVITAANGGSPEAPKKAGSSDKIPGEPGDSHPVNTPSNGGTPEKALPDNKNPDALTTSEPPTKTPVVGNNSDPPRKTGSNDQIAIGPSVDAHPTNNPAPVPPSVTPTTSSTSNTTRSGGTNPTPKTSPTPASRPISDPVPQGTPSTTGEVGNSSTRIRGSDIHTPFSQPTKVLPQANSTSVDSSPVPLDTLRPGISKTPKSSHKSSSSQNEFTTTLKIVLPIVGGIGALYILWTVIRKWKFRPSRKFEQRLDGYDVFEPRPPSFVEKSYDRNYPSHSEFYSMNHTENGSSAGHSDYYNDGVQGSGSGHTPIELVYPTMKDGYEYNRYSPQRTFTLPGSSSPRQDPANDYLTQQQAYADLHATLQLPPPVFVSDSHIPSWYEMGVDPQPVKQ
ncbi:uncharacterized protein MELLADRAFT_101196 [Melampsora larici-populina 98AG31]|uniref:Uncharacterized protein n=1 Tax=Melampsora larici-populina (strain 98AG31 / pathotype 3-4-7) TaxID=747676 RepID=F4R3X7_MELLP|nr:uncharacterized protein MELLADRAFT_101196 [Melampsora larici-populina 98AG31]EGG12699.1 hypothetical protein MELLADRAFT_101196 [Melampsora larici-populina 98AG31]